MFQSQATEMRSNNSTFEEEENKMKSGRRKVHPQHMRSEDFVYEFDY